MTNLEKIIENDGERFIRAIADVICFNPKKHIVNTIEPFLCGECELLKEEAEEDKPKLLIAPTAFGFFDIDKKFRETFYKWEGE